MENKVKIICYADDTVTISEDESAKTLA